MLFVQHNLQHFSQCRHNAVPDLPKTKNETVRFIITIQIFLNENNIMYLDEPSLHVTCFCCLYCSIYQTFSPTHSVEEKFCWCQATIKTIFYKSFSFRSLSWKQWRNSYIYSFLHKSEACLLKNCHYTNYYLQYTSKWGSDLLSKPSGTLFPLRACWPTHAIIWEMLIKEPGKKIVVFGSV